MDPKTKIIPFDYRERILEKAKAYTESVEKFIAETEKAVPLLISALSDADEDLKHKIIILLGGITKDEVVRPIYRFMSDTTQSEELRRAAAIQLSLLGSFLEDTDELLDNLCRDLSHADSSIRSNAAFALGWDGNRPAAGKLRALLSDKHPDVQQAAICALANIGDSEQLGILIREMDKASFEKKRVIICNLWRFSENEKRVLAILLQCLENENDQLRMDALVSFGMLSRAHNHLMVYARCLSDPYAEIREQALRHLFENPMKAAMALKKEILSLVEDPVPAVRRQAIRLVRRCNWTWG